MSDLHLVSIQFKSPFNNSLKFIHKFSEHNRHAEFDFEIKYFLFWSYDPWFAENTHFTLTLPIILAPIKQIIFHT